MSIQQTMKSSVLFRIEKRVSNNRSQMTKQISKESTTQLQLATTKQLHLGALVQVAARKRGSRDKSDKNFNNFGVTTDMLFLTGR